MSESAQPLEADIQRLANGWRIRLPIRREEITIEKRTVVFEEVEIRREQVEDVAHIEEAVRPSRGPTT